MIAHRLFRRSITLLTLATLACAGALRGQSAPTGHLLVLSKRAHTLSIVDPTTLKVIASAPVGDDPHEVIASTDGRTAFVSNYGFGSLHTLAVIDLTSHLALAPIDLGPLTGPHGLAFIQGEVWFTAEGAKVVGRVNPATRTVDRVIGTGQDRTHMLLVSPDSEHIIVTNVSSGTVSFLDQVERRPPPGPPPGAPAGSPPPGPPPGGGQHRDWQQTLVRVGNGSEGFDRSPDGHEVWVGNAQDGTVSVIDTTTRRVTATLPVAAEGVNRLKFTLDGRYVLLAGRGPTPLIVVDAHSHAVLKRLAIGTGAAGIVMEPSGRRVFVACSPDNDVAVIDLQTLTMTGKIDAGDEPDGMTWAAASPQ